MRMYSLSINHLPSCNKGELVRPSTTRSIQIVEQTVRLKPINKRNGKHCLVGFALPRITSIMVNYEGELYVLPRIENPSMKFKYEVWENGNVQVW